jgi:hypothetical protein
MVSYFCASPKEQGAEQVRESKNGDKDCQNRKTETKTTGFGT